MKKDITPDTIHHANCKTCRSEYRKLAERLFIEGVSKTEITRRTGLSYDTLTTHFNKHMPTHVKQQVYADAKFEAASNVVEADRRDVISTMNKLASEAEKLMEIAKKAGNTKGALDAVRELRHQVQLSVTLLQSITPDDGVVLPKNREWLKARHVLLDLFDEHPEVRAKFVARMRDAIPGSMDGC